MWSDKSQQIRRMRVSSHAELIVKRLVDVSVALVGLVVLSPFIGFLSLLIFFCLGSPILFRQKRPGLRCRPFVLLKFRTMSEERDDKGRLLRDEYRLTRLGSFMRRWSLDEIPQLFNVITGDVSLVGPRPLLMEYLDRYSPKQLRRHDVKPGITGWTQVKGRNAMSWEEKFALDLWYVDNWSLILDAKILLLTMVTVLKGEGISHSGNVTMPEFLGTKENATKEKI